MAHCHLAGNEDLCFLVWTVKVIWLSQGSAQSVPLPSLSVHNVGTVWSASRSLAALPCCISYSPRLPISAPPTSLDECFFFKSLVVGLPYSSIFWQFWLFFIFKFFVVLLLVVRGGKVYLPRPLFWPEVLDFSFMVKSK